MGIEQTSTQLSKKSTHPSKKTNKQKHQQKKGWLQKLSRLMSFLNFTWVKKIVSRYSIKAETSSEIERPRMNFKRRGSNTKRARGRR